MAALDRLMAPATGKTVLVTGANGYIGRAVAQSFQRAGYKTLGLIRSSQSAHALQNHTIIPIVGSAKDRESTLQAIKQHAKVIDIVVSTTDDKNDFAGHFNDTIALFRAIARTSAEHGVRPLVLMTSGCKDYGAQDELDGNPNLRGHTEESPLQPPEFLKQRTTYSQKILDEESFDSVVLRPTLVHGGDSSWLGGFFHMAEQAKSKNKPLRFAADPRTIIHSMNVHDCGDAYVALANHSNRADIAGQCFNISPGNRYETLGDIGDALVKSYGLTGVEYDPPKVNIITPTNALINFSQFVGSEKLRGLTGFTDSRPMFAQDLERYRAEYEAEGGKPTK